MASLSSTPQRFAAQTPRQFGWVPSFHSPKAINSALADSKAARASPWRSPSCSRNVFWKKPSNTVYTAVLFEKPAGSLGCSPCCLAFASQWQLCDRHVCDSPLSKTVKIPCLDVAKLAQRSTRHWLVRLERLPYSSQHLSNRVVIQSLTPVITISIINPGEKSNLSQHIRNLSISTKDTISAKACARSAICAALRGIESEDLAGFLQPGGSILDQLVLFGLGPGCPSKR